MASTFTTSYIEDAVAVMHRHRKLAEDAIAQVTDEQLLELIDPEANSIALLVKHLAGNLRSRWTDFLTSDGEKPDRDRDTEFLDPPATRDALLKMWNEAWDRAFAALGSLSDADLSRTVMIRGEKHSVMQAINRQVAHQAYHCGQIVLLAKHFQYARWKTLSIPRGASGRFNDAVRKGLPGTR